MRKSNVWRADALTSKDVQAIFSHGHSGSNSIPLENLGESTSIRAGCSRADSFPPAGERLPGNGHMLAERIDVIEAL